MTDIPPDDFLCPITRMIMDDPVYSLHTGLSYEKAAIEKWLSREGKNYCPVTYVSLFRLFVLVFDLCVFVWWVVLRISCLLLRVPS